MINSLTLARAERSSLIKMHSKLIKEKMELDKFFSDWLEENELDHDHLDDPNWQIYKTKLEEYRNVSSLIKSAEFQLRK